MKRAIVVLAAVGSIVGTGRQAGASECDCALGVRLYETCRVPDWRRNFPAGAGDYAALGDLLENLIEGTEEARLCYETSGWREEGESCSAACLPELLDRTLRDVVEATEDPVRRGAIAVAYAVFMDADSPEKTWIARYGDGAVAVLSRVKDPTSLAAILKMMEFYDLSRPDVVDAIVPLLSHDSELVRRLAWNRFYDYTHCPLMESWRRDRLPNAKQTEKARAWWRKEREP